MVKPNITEGEWFITDYYKAPKHSVCDIGGEYTIGADPGNNVDVSAKADAKAIAAVPEMIDALLECYHLIKALKKTDQWGVNVHEVDEENVKQALEKAGCEF